MTYHLIRIPSEGGYIGSQGCTHLSIYAQGWSHDSSAKYYNEGAALIPVLQLPVI